MRELSDDEVFGSTAELSDEEVFGATPVVSKPSTSLAMPVLDPLGLSRPGAATTPRVSVLQDLPPDPQAFDMRKASAVRNAIAATPTARGQQFMSEGPAVDEGFFDNAVRVARKVLGGINESTAGIVRNAADLVGADSVADFARRSSRASREFAGKTVAAPVSIDGFAPGSIVQDLPEAAENAAVSIGQQLPAMVTGSVPTALGLMVAQSYGQQYNKVRDSGLDVMPGMANAGLTAVFEYLGERFGGLPQQISGLSQAFAGNRPAAALRDLAAGGVKEVPGEALITYPGQYLVDTLPGIGTNSDPSVAQFLEGFKDTVLTASLQGGAMAGAGTAVVEARQQFARLNPEQQLAAASRILAMVERDAPLPGQPEPQADAPARASVAPPAPAAAPLANPDEVVQSIVGAIAQADEVAASRRPRPHTPQAAEVELTDAEVFGAEQTTPRPEQPTQESAPLPADAPASPDPQGVAANDQGAAMPGAAAPTTGPDALAVPSAPLQVEQPKPPASMIAQQQPPGATPVRLGISSQPLEEGGQPFADKATAQREKKLHPGLRVVRVAGGYALADKTPAQLAAEAKAAARIKGANAGTGSAPISAHEFIVRRGGLDQSTMADVGFDRNHRVGNRTLFAGKGKRGLTLEQATQALREAGYLNEDDISAAAELIRRSVRTPQFTPEGWERLAQAESEARYTDYLEAQQELGDDPFAPPADYTADLESIDPNRADEQTRRELAALLKQADVFDIDTETLLEDAARQTADQTDHEFYARAIQLTREAIAAGTRGGSSGAPVRDGERQPDEAEREGDADGGQDLGAQGPAGEPEGLTAYTREDLAGRQAQRDQREIEEQRTRRELERRAQADAQRDDFVLSGSDRDADQAAARGQGGLFDAPADPPAPATLPDDDQLGRTGKGPLPVPESAFADLLEKAAGDSESDIFAAPERTVRTEDRAKLAGTITTDQAATELEAWKAEARRQGQTGGNAGRTVLSLFDASGAWARPWEEAGYNVVTFDLQTGQDIMGFDATSLLEEHGNDEIFAILAAPPCTDFSSSGAQYWGQKDADGRTALSVELVRQTLRTVELFKPHVWSLENPVGRIQRMTGLPKPALTFQPHNFGDPYTKRTMLWGSMETELPLANVAPTQGSKIANLSGTDKYGRSLTPEGFAYAFFMANNAQALGDVGLLTREFRGLPRADIQAALDGGMTADDVRTLVADAYHDGDVEGAAELLRKATKLDLDENGDTNVEQPRRPYRDDRQTELDLELERHLERYQGEPNRSGQTGAGVARARGDGVAATLDLFAAGDVFGQELARELASNHTASLVGRRVDSPEEFATVAQVYRDRRFETFRVVYLDDQSRVISQLGMTSRLPASAAAIAGDDVAEYFDELTRVARNVGASGFYLLHNHPSGSAAASTADQALTRRYAQEMRGRAPGVKFLGHVVIDTNQYSLIDADGRPSLHHKDFGAIEPLREGEFSGLRLSGPADVMALAKRIEIDESAVTLILTNSQLHVERITTIPRAAVTDDDAVNRRSLARALLQNNASKAIAVSSDYKALKQLGKLTLDGIFVPADGGKPASLAEMGVHPGGDVFGSARRTRITSDTSADFRGMRRLANIEAVRKGLPFPKVAEPGADYNATPEPPRRTRGWNPIGRDAMGNVKFVWGEVALDVANAALAPIMTRFGMRMATPELRRQLRQMKATIEEANRQASEVATAMSGMVEADRELVSDLVEKMLKPGVVPPEHVVRVADAITRSMDRQTDELLELGMLTPQSAERWRGQYLPRLYRKYQDDLLQKDATWLQRLFKTAQPLMRGLKADSLKARGLFEEVSVGEAPQWLSMGYELRDTHWRLNQGELELRNPDIIPPAAREKVVVWRDFTREEREEMGEMRDALLRYVQGYTAMQRDIAAGRLFDNIARNPEWVRRSGSTGWTRVPDTEITGTAGVKRYGNLAGLWVREDIMAHLTQFEEAGNDALQLWRDALGLWKEGKTALNPVAHFNNIVSNVSMAHFAGVSYWDVHKYVAAVRDLVNGAPMLEEGRQVGLFTGSFTKEELIQSLPKELQDLMKLPEAALKRAGRQFWNALTFWLRTPLRNAYEFEDVFFKYVIYRDARGRGLSPEEATDYALRYIFTYDDLPSGARKVRDYAIPFFAWSYKAIPALLHTAMHYPWRFLAPAGVLHGVNLAAYALAAGDEGDDWLERIAKGRALEEEERAVLPERMRGQGALLNPKSIRLGYNDLTGHPIFMDVSRVIPGGDMFDMENQSGGLPIPAPLMPNHPVLGLFSSMVANRELFMGRDLVDRNDTAAEAFEKRAKWMAGFILPAVAPGGYHSQRLADALANAADITISTPLGEFTGVDRAGQPVQPGFAALQTFGVKVRPIDLDLERERRGADNQALVRSITAEVRAMARLHQRGAATDKMLERTREGAREKLDRIREEQP